MSWHRWATITYMLIFALTASMAAQERKLAGIQLQMKPQAVLELLGEPTAQIVPQPPIAAPSGAMGGMMMGAPGAMPGMQADNTLVFITSAKAPNGKLIHKEYEIDPNQGPDLSDLLGAQRPPALGGPGMVRPFGLAGAPAGAPGALPLWAYVVRVNRLSINQQELIYRINDYYSLGITVTGQGAEARVSDIIACSLEPLVEQYDKATKTYVRNTKTRSQLNFYSATLRKLVPAGTSKSVGIGSRLADVLRAHGWPSAFLPFEAPEITRVSATKTPPPAASAAARRAPAGAPAAKPAVIAPPAPRNVIFTDGAATNINAAFSDSCMLLYPDDTLSMTLVNFTVVRIQMGEGVTMPAGL